MCVLFVSLFVRIRLFCFACFISYFASFLLCLLASHHHAVYYPETNGTHCSATTTTKEYHARTYAIQLLCCVIKSVLHSATAVLLYEIGKTLCWMFSPLTALPFHWQLDMILIRTFVYYSIPMSQSSAPSLSLQNAIKYPFSQHFLCWTKNNIQSWQKQSETRIKQSSFMTNTILLDNINHNKKN